MSKKYKFKSKTEMRFHGFMGIIGIFLCLFVLTTSDITSLETIAFALCIPVFIYFSYKAFTGIVPGYKEGLVFVEKQVKSKSKIDVWLINKSWYRRAVVSGLPESYKQGVKDAYAFYSVGKQLSLEEVIK
jgi:Ca2+/Na+ antiporter